MRTLTAEWRPDRKGDTARPGMVGVVETRNMPEATIPESIVSLNEKSLKTDPHELVRKTVEDTLNGLSEEETDDLMAERHGRTADREVYRAGRCDRSATVPSGEVTVCMPKLEGVRFAATVTGCCRRRETGVEEATIETCLAGCRPGGLRASPRSPADRASRPPPPPISTGRRSSRLRSGATARPGAPAPMCLRRRDTPQANPERPPRERDRDGRDRSQRRRVPRGHRCR